MFYEIVQNTSSEHVTRLAAIRKKLVDEAWMSEAAVDYICRVFLTAIGKEELAGKTQESKSRSKTEPKQNSASMPNPQFQPQLKPPKPKRKIWAAVAASPDYRHYLFGFFGR